MEDLPNSTITEVDAFTARWRLRAAAEGGLTESIFLDRGEPNSLPSVRASDALLGLRLLTNAMLHEAHQQHLETIEGLPDETVLGILHAVLRYLNTNRYISPDGLVAEDVQTLIDECAEALVAEGVPLAKAEADAIRKLATAYETPSYGDTCGDHIVRAVVARRWPTFIPGAPKLTASNITLFDGGNGAIGAVLQLLVKHEVLISGDIVVIQEPAYGPYQTVCRDLGLTVIPLRTSQENGWLPNSADFEALTDAIGDRQVKLIISVNPSNPTGRASDQATIDQLAEFCRTHQCLALEDVVYSEFLPTGTVHSLWARLPEQTILIGSFSKYYRCPGSRIGFLIMTDATLAFGSQLLHIHSPHTTSEFSQELTAAKGPGPNGSLSHTAHMPRPMQVETLVRLVIDRDNGVTYTAELHRKWSAFYHALGLPTPEEEVGLVGAFVPYYVPLDLLTLVEARAQNSSHYRFLLQRMRQGSLQPWEFLHGLARDTGVVLLPAATFFSDATKHQWVVRASVANQPLPQILLAAKHLNRYLDSLAFGKAKEVKEPHPLPLAA